MIKAEWSKIFRNKKLIIPMIAVLFIPVLYAGMFLWAFWDPYENLDDMPVAIVNNDKGATIDGENKTLGKDLVEKLIDSKKFKFEEVSADEGEKRLKDQEYYLLIEIPENFSENAGTLLDDHPQKLNLIYRPNEGFNFLSGQIGGTAIELVRAEVNSKVSATYAEKLFNNIGKLGDGFGEAADGAGQLNDGAGKLNDGANKLHEGLNTAGTGVSELSKGSSTLKAGTNELSSKLSGNTPKITALNDGAGKINQGVAGLSASVHDQLLPGAQQVAAGVEQLVNGVGAMAGKVPELKKGVNDLATGADELNKKSAPLPDATAKLAGGMNQLTPNLIGVINASGLPQEKKTEMIKALNDLTAGATELNKQAPQLVGGINQLADGTALLNSQVSKMAVPPTDQATKLVEGAKAVATGVQTLDTKVANELLPGTNQLAAGTNQLATSWGDAVKGASALDAGAGKIQGGLQQLNGGIVQLEDGSVQLVDGTTQLNDGTSTLKEKLAEASDKASEVKATDETYDMVGSPVKVDTESVNHVPNYGTGFAPYFISLGLFVGALLISIVFPLVEPAIKPKNGFSWFASKTVVLAVVGLFQAIIAALIVLYGLGLEPENTWAFLLTTLLTSYTFLALIQMLVTLFSDPGRFMAILILILQLTTSAGTFPLELVPSQLHIFNKLLPMTYSVSSFKAAISTGDMSFYWFNNSVLIGFTVVCLAITFGYFALLYTRRYSKVEATN